MTTFFLLRWGLDILPRLACKLWAQKVLLPQLLEELNYRLMPLGPIIAIILLIPYHVTGCCVRVAHTIKTDWEKCHVKLRRINKAGGERLKFLTWYR